MVETDRFGQKKTIVKKGFAKLTEKNSRFIGIIDNVDNREDFDTFLNRIREEYPDATHHCWAFRIEGEELAGDDGEPSGSAGLPILRVITGADLINSACVVVRYFGGTKLGIGGLIRAYSSCASAAISEASVEVFIPKTTYKVVLPYSIYRDFESSLSKLGGELIDSEFGEEVKIVLQIPDKYCPILEDALANLSHGKLKLRKI